MLLVLSLVLVLVLLLLVLDWGEHVLHRRRSAVFVFRVRGFWPDRRCTPAH
jgi:hypothetical protein